jgi:hypothetical protein
MLTRSDELVGTLLMHLMGLDDGLSCRLMDAEVYRHFNRDNDRNADGTMAISTRLASALDWMDQHS